MSLKEKLGWMQVPVTGVGVVGMLLSISSASALGPPQGDGFVTGLAYFFLYIIGGASYFLTVIGLLIPGEGKYAVRFSVNQRRLLKLSAVTAVLSVVAPVVFWPLAARFSIEIGSLATLWLICLFLSVLCSSTAVVWRFSEFLKGKYFSRPEELRTETD